MRRLPTILTLTALTLLLGATNALAVDGGEGTYGMADDKVVTTAGFIVIIFFPLFILLATLLQGRLEARKDARKKAAKARRSSKVWAGGW